MKSIAFRDSRNPWSYVHALGCYGLALSMGLLGLSPWGAAAVTLALGGLWELGDCLLDCMDPRGGDWYDLLWDAAGCAGAALCLIVAT